MTLQAAQTEVRSRWRQVLAGTGGIVLAVGALGIAGFMFWRTSGGKPPTAAERVFVCSETQKSFKYSMEPGDSYPVMSPYTNQKTGYPCEKCYWTRDGKAKREPTYVILNKWLGKEGPTICPDCGREVRPHNPPPPYKLMNEANAGGSN